MSLRKIGLPKRRTVDIQLVDLDDIDLHIRKSLREIVLEFCVVANDDQIAAVKILRRKIFHIRRSDCRNASHVSVQLGCWNAQTVKVCKCARKSGGRLQVSSEATGEYELPRIQFGVGGTCLGKPLKLRNDEFGDLGRGFVFRLCASPEIRHLIPPGKRASGAIAQPAFDPDLLIQPGRVATTEKRVEN